MRVCERMDCGAAHAQARTACACAQVREDVCVDVHAVSSYCAHACHGGGGMQDFCTKYRGIRATRGDGNCFYRSFLISLGEAFVAAGVKPAGTADASAGPMQAKYEQLLQYVDGSAEKLLALGYPDITIPDFHSEMLAFLTSLSAPGATPDTVAATFRDPSLGLYIITYLRCLCR
ncbi:hypothetical protein EON66_10725 [archaeon]|nr:MAG: hypothetical protein EON66_10725 [archaeon]